MFAEDPKPFRLEIDRLPLFKSDPLVVIPHHLDFNQPLAIFSIQFDTNRGPKRPDINNRGGQG